HPVVPTDGAGQILARLARNDGLPMIANHPRALGEVRIVGDHHSALTGHHVLRLLEAEDPAVSHGPYQPALVPSSWRLRTVFDHFEMMAARDREDRVHIGWVPQKMHRDHRFRARRNGLLKLS